jgi:hypothetical protein
VREPRRQRRHGEIMNVAEGAGAGSRVAWELVNRSESDPRIIRDDVFGPVAMVRIEIPDRDPLCATGERIERGDGDIAEITEPHRAIAHRVMTRRTHQAERALSLQRCARRLHRRTGGPQSMFAAAWIGRRIRIEVVQRFANSREMFRSVSTQHFRFVGGLGLFPVPIFMSALQKRDSADDSCGPLRVPWRRIFDTTWIVKNNHQNFARLQL